MTGLLATLIGLAIAGGLFAALIVARKRQCGFAQAIALLKLRSLFDLHLPDRKEPSTHSRRPVVQLYSRQSGLDAAALWAALDRNCLHVLHEDDQRSLLLFGLRLFARTAHAGDHSAIEAALKEGRSVTLGFPQNAEPTPETLTAYKHAATLAREHGAVLQALHVRGSSLSTLVGLVPFGSAAPPFGSAAAGADCAARSRRSRNRLRTAPPIRATKTGFMTCWPKPGLPATTSTAVCFWHSGTLPTDMARRGQCSRMRWAASYPTRNS